MTAPATVLGSLRGAGVHPCGACGALVETCGHWHPAYVAPQSNPRRKELRDRARAQAAAAVDDFLKRNGMGTLP